MTTAVGIANPIRIMSRRSQQKGWITFTFTRRFSTMKMVGWVGAWTDRQTDRQTCTFTQNYWVFGLRPSSNVLDSREHNVSETGSVSETLCFLVSRIPDDGQSPKTQ
jgi:hypothetical protein